MIKSLIIIVIYCLIATLVIAILNVLYEKQCKKNNEEVAGWEFGAFIFFGYLWPLFLVMLPFLIFYIFLTKLFK